MVSKQGSTFAGQLVRLREAAGLSQYKLSRKAGLSRQALSLLELGEREPGWITVQRLANALGVDCRAFIDANLEMPEPPTPRPRGRPPKDTPSTPPAADLEDTQQTTPPKAPILIPNWRELLRNAVLRVLHHEGPLTSKQLVVYCEKHIPPEVANRKYLSLREARKCRRGESVDEQIWMGKQKIVQEFLARLRRQGKIERSGLTPDEVWVIPSPKGKR
jgi:transcriptional regulator with XRE-family HTH domain